MKKEVQFKKLFHLSSIVTDHFPNSGARILDFLLFNLLGNKILSDYLHRSAQKKLVRINNNNKFLVVSDLNIGDAVIATCGISALRTIFPFAEIDITIKNSTECFIKGNPEISNIYPIFNGAPYPTEKDLLKLRKVVNDKDYDLIFNFSPLISDKIFGEKNVVNYSLIASEIVRNENSENSVKNICYLANNFVEKVLHNFLKSEFNVKFAGANIYLSDDAIEKAEKFLMSRNISRQNPIVMFNPDASAKYTRIPFDVQINLLKRISDLGTTVLLGAGHVEKLIEQRLYAALPPAYRKKIIIIPSSTELDTYSAIIDQSDVFITGDTGPLHLAAARKFSTKTGKSLRNKTAVFSVFGSTPPKVYGYDSRLPGYFAANQDVLSRVFIADSPCMKHYMY